MGIYTKWVCPHLQDWVMAGEAFARTRPEVLKEARGAVFEIGFGSGHNLAHYPSHVTRLVTADPSAVLARLARKRVLESRIQVVRQRARGEFLPLADGVFDTVVSTWTLCSIAGVEQALGELHRILKPGGRFLFVEHGLADDPRSQWWQHRLTPLQKVVGDGCHLDRNIKTLIEQGGFRMVELENFCFSHVPRWAGYQYKGIAVRE